MRHFWQATIVALAVFSAPSLAAAHMTAFDPGVPPGGVQSGSIMLPNGEQAPVLTQDRCEAQKQGNESCNGATGLFFRTDAPLAAGTSVTFVVNANGQSLRGRAVIGSGGMLVASAAPQPAQTGGLETLYSTARKRVEPLQDTPVASTVISGQKLQLGFNADLKSMQFPAPNVNIAQISSFSNAISVSIRGITNADIDSSIDPPVAIFVDGVYLARPVASSLDLFDVEAVEVLRGPQGTLFGRNTTAGAIQVRTTRPILDEFQFRGRLNVGEYGRIDIRTAVNMPIVDGKVAARLAFQSQNMDGYYRSGVDNSKLGKEDIIAIRPSIKFQPSDNFDISIIGEYHRNKSETTPQHNISTTGQAICGLIPCDISTEDIITGDSPYVIPNYSEHPEIDAEIWGLTLEMNWDVGPGVITSVSNYRDTKEFIDVTVDNIDGFLFHTTRDQPHEQYSSELRFASTEWENFGFVAGVYYFHQEYLLTRNTWIGSDQTTATPLEGITQQDHDSFSIFFEGNYDVTDKLVFIAGGRWSWEKKDFFQRPFGLGTAGAPVDIEPTSWNNFGPKIGIEYHWTDDVMTYFTWSRGFKSGGYNGRCGQPVTCNRAYDPETVDGFEVGLKGDLFDNRLRVNLAAFWNTYKDLQRTVIVPLPGAANPQETVTDNAATADIRGIELELTALPAEGLQLDLGIGILDAEYGDFCVDLNGASDFATMPTSDCGDVVAAGDNNMNGLIEYLVDEDISDTSLTRAPKFTLSASITYEFPVGNSGNVVLNARWNYTSKLFINSENRSPRKATNLVDASIGYEDGDGRYRVSLYGHNLTGETYNVTETLVGALLNTMTINYPRRWGIEIAWDL